MAVYIYARQSSGDEERSISVEQQISNSEKLAQQMNLKVNETFQDLNTSGRLYWSGAESFAQLDFHVRLKTLVFGGNMPPNTTFAPHSAFFKHSQTPL